MELVRGGEAARQAAELTEAFLGYLCHRYENYRTATHAAVDDSASS